MVLECNHQGWSRETSPLGPCLTGQPIKNYGPAIHVLYRQESSLIGEPPDNILILLMALCQAFSHNFPYIRTWLTLEYEIEFCLFLTRQSTQIGHFILSLNIPKRHCHRDPLSNKVYIIIIFLLHYLNKRLYLIFNKLSN